MASCTTSARARFSKARLEPPICLHPAGAPGTILEARGLPRRSDESLYVRIYPCFPSERTMRDF
jgi:hypothetical protein